MVIGIAIFVSGSSRYKKQPPHGSMISIAAGIFWQGLTSSRKVAEGQHWLEKASTEHGGDYEPADVEGMKYLWKIVPYLMVMIPFWGIYGQTKTAFQIQVSSSICCKISSANDAVCECNVNAVVLSRVVKWIWIWEISNYQCLP
jgi:hypothetical protein